jgi:phosphatidylserine/phosphatidylglycerophosphate/cardiolipin synthase-like enzyme
MPFHDTAVCIEGESAMDIGHHFVTLWNNAKINSHNKKSKLANITT